MSAEEAIRAYLQGRMDRREFISTLRAIGVTAGAAVAYAQLLGTPNGSSAMAEALTTLGQVSGPVALTPGELATLEAFAARILPTTDTPGAAEAGAADYVDIALGDAYRPQLARYRQALGELERHSVSTRGASFVALTPDQQDEILRDLERGAIEEVEGGADFFQLARRHILEGVFCEPSYGGNRDLVGWQLVGFPGQRYGYRDAYINRVVDAAPVAVDGMPGRETEV
jgi:gluconate 2-dehydrogenase gamma chain